MRQHGAPHAPGPTARRGRGHGRGRGRGRGRADTLSQRSGQTAQCHAALQKKPRGDDFAQCVREGET